MTSRDRWLRELTSSRHVHRFLARIGTASSLASGPPVADEELRTYLGSLRGGRDDAQVLLEVLEIFANGYGDFIQTVLPKLLTALVNRTGHVQEVVGPAIRGVVRWDLTKVARTNRTLPSVRYISNVQRRSYDTPENMLLCWLLRDIAHGIEHVARRLGTQRLHPTLRAVMEGCHDALRNDALAGVAAVREISPQMVQVASHSRRPGYREVARLAQRRARMRERGDVARWSLALELLRTNWLEPVSDDDLFELFGLSTTLSVLSEELGLGPPVHYGLLGSPLEPAATFRTSALVVSVYFNRTPGSLLGTGVSRYLDVIASYRGIGGYSRRPDILLRAEKPGEVPRSFILEIKNVGAAAYLRESIYKVFGYLWDYHALFKAQSGRLGALYVPEGAAAFSGTEEVSSRIVIVTEGDRTRLSAVLREGLNL